MSDIGKTERETQNRVIALFRQELGYRYLGNRMYRDGNSNIEEALSCRVSDQKRLYSGTNQPRCVSAARGGRQRQSRAVRQQ